MRKLAGLLTMMLLAVVVLAACGADDDDGGDATEEATEAVVSTEIEEAATEEVTEAADDEDAPAVIEAEDEGTPIPAGTPVVAATPEAVAVPDFEASPAAAASPVTAASPVAATPASASSAAAPAASGSTDGETLSLSGEVVLPGAQNETYVVSDDGCVGLGEYSDMRTGRQLVVRDEAGSIIGVTTIEASDSAEECAWTFAVDVPASEFYAVSIPMEVEHIFTQDDVQADGGQITLPLR